MSQRVPQMREQGYVFPELLEERVENGPHEARFFSYITDVVYLDMFEKKYTGTTPFERRTLSAVILYAMCKGHFSINDILEFSEDSIGVQWILNGMKMPCSMTVRRTVKSLLDEIDKLFEQVLFICEELSLIGKKRTYIDGVKIKANASKHKAMSYGHLIKKIGKGKNELELLFDIVKDKIDGFEDLSDGEMRSFINREADKVHNILIKNHQKSLEIREKQTFDMDSNEDDEKNEIDYDALNKQSDILKNACKETYDETLETLNNIAYVNKRVSRMENAKTELEDRWKNENGNKKIPDKKQINFTDPDSCIMVTKHHGVQQCYNNFAIVDDKAHIILGTHTSSNSTDYLSLIPTIENTEEIYGSLESIQLGADAGFFSVDNISYTNEKGIDYYASYPEPKSDYSKDKFKYDYETDTYTCPAGNILNRQSKSMNVKLCKYSNEDACVSCESISKCTKAKDGVRRIERDMENDKIREEAKEKAKSEEGKEILRLRKSIPEPVWGNIKTQDGLIQMHYRGIEKASLEFKLHCVMHNLRKILKVYFYSKSYQEIVHGAEDIYLQTA